MRGNYPRYIFRWVRLHQQRRRTARYAAARRTERTPICPAGVCDATVSVPAVDRQPSSLCDWSLNVNVRHTDPDNRYSLARSQST